MSLLFSEPGLRRLDEIVQQSLLCAFDFDGTLAPIVAQPEHARLPDDIRQHLLTLSGYAPVAIITGRSIEDTYSRLGFDPDFIVGNHGMEGVPGWEAQAQRHQATCVGWRTQLARVLQDGDAGIRLEDKRYSLSVHYRTADDTDEAKALLIRLFGTLEPQPRVVGGKYVFNLLPQDAAHKGDALEQLIAICGARHALYVGDDVTDEDVFRLQRRDLLSVRIEHAPQSAAQFFLPRPEDIVQLLTELTARLRAAGVVNWLQTEAAGRLTQPQDTHTHENA